MAEQDEQHPDGTGDVCSDTAAVGGRERAVEVLLASDTRLEMSESFKPEPGRLYIRISSEKGRLSSESLIYARNDGWQELIGQTNDSFFYPKEKPHFWMVGTEGRRIEAGEVPIGADRNTGKTIVCYYPTDRELQNLLSTFKDDEGGSLKKWLDEICKDNELLPDEKARLRKIERRVLDETLPDQIIARCDELFGELDKIQGSGVLAKAFRRLVESILSETRFAQPDVITKTLTEVARLSERLARIDSSFFQDLDEQGRVEFLSKLQKLQEIVERLQSINPDDREIIKPPSQFASQKIEEFIRHAQAALLG